MDNEHFIVSFAKACGNGNLPLSECGPVWQCGIIAVLLVAAISVLVMLKLHDYTQSASA